MIRKGRSDRYGLLFGVCSTLQMATRLAPFFQVLLMVLLGPIEGGRGFDLGDDRLPEVGLGRGF
jgi:hypothetical protein